MMIRPLKSLWPVGAKKLQALLTKLGWPLRAVPLLAGFGLDLSIDSW